VIVTLIVFGAAAILLVTGYLVIKFGIEENAGSRDLPAISDTDADEHLKPLLTANAEEKTLVTDLRQRRMLLRPRGISERKAAVLAAKVTRRTMKLRGLARMSQEAGRRLNRGIEGFIPDEDRRAAREAFGTAARRGKHRGERPSKTAPALRTPAEQVAATPDLFPAAAPLIPLPDGGPMFTEKTLHEAPGHLPDQPADLLPLLTSLAQGQAGGLADDPLAAELAARDYDSRHYREPEDPHDVLTDEEEADALVGDVGPTAIGASGPDSNTEAASVGEQGLYDRDADRWGDSLIMQAIKIGTAPGRGGEAGTRA
jgi:hypothetical protein